MADFDLGKPAITQSKAKLLPNVPDKDAVPRTQTQKHTHMKKHYLSPEVEVTLVTLETNLLGNSGENLTSSAAAFYDWDDEE